MSVETTCLRMLVAAQAAVLQVFPKASVTPDRKDSYPIIVSAFPKLIILFKCTAGKVG